MRAKIILPNIVAVLLVGLIVFAIVNSNMRAEAIGDLGDKVTAAQKAFMPFEALQAHTLLNETDAIAKAKNTTEAFAPVQLERAEGESDEHYKKLVRTQWYSKCEEVVSGLSETKLGDGRLPEMLFLTDSNGVVITRNTRPNACPSTYNVSEAIPVVKRALDGEAIYALWSITDSSFNPKKKNTKMCHLMNTGLMEIAAAPIWHGGDIKGALVVGNRISNNSKVELLGGLNVVTLMKAEVTNLPLQGEKGAAQIAQAASSKVVEAIADGQISEVFDLTVGGGQYEAIVVPITKSRATLILKSNGESVGARMFSLDFKGSKPANGAQVVVAGLDVYNSSLGTDTTVKTIRNRMNNLKIAALVAKSLGTGKPSKLLELEIEGEIYSAVISPSMAAEKKDRVVNLILGSQREAIAGIRSVYVILLGVGFMLCFIIVVGIILSNHFRRPVVEIEEGLLKVMNGEFDYRFDVKSTEVGGLSYRINQLIDVLTGEEESDDD